MSKPLTAAAVEKYRPAAKRRIVRDAGARSLFLVIEPSGHKSWRMRFRRPDGKPGKLTLGPVDLAGESADAPVVGMPLTLAAARQLATQIHRERALGHDPIADHKASKLRQRTALVEATDNAFGIAAKDFVERYASKKVRRWAELSRLLGLRPTDDGLAVIPGGLAQRWADKPVAEIDGHDVHTVVAETRERGAPGLERRGDGPSEARARAMLSCLSRMFRWLVEHRRVETNPCATVHRPEAPPARDRVLTNAEIVEFWKAAGSVGEPFGAVLKLLLLTGCRLREIARLRWDEVSESQINLPGSRTKNHKPHAIPLAPLAQEIIAGVPRIECPFVFTTDGRSPVSPGSKIKGRLDGLMGNPPHWRIHDLRRTAATGMAELGIAPHIVEAALNHISGAKAGVAGTYNRAAYLPERKAALERWAAHIAGLVSGDGAKVVPMQKRKG